MLYHRKYIGNAAPDRQTYPLSYGHLPALQGVTLGVPKEKPIPRKSLPLYVTRTTKTQLTLTKIVHNCA